MANREGLQNLTIQEFLDYPLPGNVQALADKEIQNFVGPNTLQSLKLKGENNIVSKELAAVSRKMDLLEISSFLSNGIENIKNVSIADIDVSQDLAQLYNDGAPITNAQLSNEDEGWKYILFALWAYHWYTTCHNAMADKFGIWVPDLEEPFAKLDSYMGNIGTN